MPDEDVPVLIAGGSLVGMSMAMLLGVHGVRSLVVERHAGSAIHPRAAFILQRSMEILRVAGIEDPVREGSYAQFEPDGAIMSVETLVGKELAWHIPKLNEGVRDMSPSERLFVTQIGLEPLLRGRAEELGAEPRFATELVESEQDADGVTSVIRDRASGETSTVRSRYLVAADGPRSPTRERLGIAMSGRGVFSKAITIYFRADVEPLLRGRNLSVILVMNEIFAGFFRIEKPYRSGFLVVHSIGDPTNPITDVWDLDEQRCIELVRAGLGVDDIDVTIEDVMRWEATADVADRFRDGRIFLAGDAAHVMPPYGGYGGNTGIHDAHNLAWKLAAVLQGRAGPELLDTYEAERRPVARFTAEQAYTRYVGRAAPYLAPGGMEPIVGDLEIDLGMCVRSRAVLDDGAGDGPSTSTPASRTVRRARARRTCGWSADGERISTIDLTGKGFVLLAGPEADAWVQAADGAEIAVAPHRGARRPRRSRRSLLRGLRDHARRCGARAPRRVRRVAGGRRSRRLGADAGGGARRGAVPGREPRFVTVRDVLALARAVRQDPPRGSWESQASGPSRSIEDAEVETSERQRLHSSERRGRGTTSHRPECDRDSRRARGTHRGRRRLGGNDHAQCPERRNDRRSQRAGSPGRHESRPARARPGRVGRGSAREGRDRPARRDAHRPARPPRRPRPRGEPERSRRASTV